MDTLSTILRISQTGLELTELLKLQDERLEQVLGIIKPLVPEDTDPRKTHFYSLIEYFTKRTQQDRCDPLTALGRVHWGISFRISLFPVL